MSSEERLFYLIRHGQTDWNVARRLQGSHDIPLNATGREQALELKAFFATHPVDLWGSSPLQRAQETIELISGQKPLILPETHEVILGPLEGLHHEEVILRFGAEDWHRWMELPPGSEDFAVPGAETPRQSTARLKNGLLDLARSHQFHAAAVCTHGFLLRRFLQDLDPVQPSRIIPNGLILTVTVELPSGTFRLREITRL